LAVISVKNLLEAGVHFGHRASRWNPKMAPYIFGKRNLIHIINLQETVKGLIKAYHFLSNLCKGGQEVLFVGTKRQAKNVIQSEALNCKMHYVSERWLGGTLTNFETIRKRLARLEELEKMEAEGKMDALSKKLGSSLRREQRKIKRNLEGIRRMSKLPGAVIIVDPQKEKIAALEAVKLNIPTIALMDTDSDPDVIDIPIPGNDDAMRSIEIICTKLAEAINIGRVQWEEKKKVEEKQRAEDDARRGDDSSDRRRQGDRKDRKGRDGRRRSGQRGGQRTGKHRTSRPTGEKTTERPGGQAGAKPAGQTAAKPADAKSAKPADAKSAKPADAKPAKPADTKPAKTEVKADSPAKKEENKEQSKE